MHAPLKKEFFCSVMGCPRSKKPSKGGKGRSFGAREDKMREHYKTVHEKSKRKRAEADDVTDQDEQKNDGYDSDEKQSKKPRTTGMYQGSTMWTDQNSFAL